jgi:hypothetical protein
VPHLATLTDGLGTEEIIAAANQTRALPVTVDQIDHD